MATGMQAMGVADLLRFASRLDKRAAPAFRHKHTTMEGIDIDGRKVESATTRGRRELI